MARMHLGSTERLVSFGKREEGRGGARRITIHKDATLPVLPDDEVGLAGLEEVTDHLIVDLEV